MIPSPDSLVLYPLSAREGYPPSPGLLPPTYRSMHTTFHRRRRSRHRDTNNAGPNTLRFSGESPPCTQHKPACGTSCRRQTRRQAIPCLAKHHIQRYRLRYKRPPHLRSGIPHATPRTTSRSLPPVHFLTCAPLPQYAPSLWLSTRMRLHSLRPRPITPCPDACTALTTCAETPSSEAAQSKRNQLGDAD